MKPSDNMIRKKDFSGPDGHKLEASLHYLHTVFAPWDRNSDPDR